MEKTLSTLRSAARLAAVLGVGCLALCFFFNIEGDERWTLWTLHFIFDRAMGVALGGAAVWLCRRWERRDRLFARLLCLEPAGKEGEL